MIAYEPMALHVEGVPSVGCNLCYYQNHRWMVTVVMTLLIYSPCVLRVEWDRWARAVPHPNLAQYPAILDLAMYLSLNKLLGFDRTVDRQWIQSEERRMRVRATESEMISRRLVTLLVILSCLSMPFAADAQQVQQVYRVGVLETISPALNAANFDAFRQGLRALGYVEGQNLVIEYRSADGDASRFPALATELVRLQVDVLVTRGTPAALAAKNAAGSIPVVMAAIGEALGLGIVANLAHQAEMSQGSARLPPNSPGSGSRCSGRCFWHQTHRGPAEHGQPLFPPQWDDRDGGPLLGIEPQLLDVRKSEEIGPCSMPPSYLVLTRSSWGRTG